MPDASAVISTDPQVEQPQCTLRRAAVLAPLWIWALQFLALQALLGLGCGRLATSHLRWLAVASAVLVAAALVLLALRRPRTGPAAGVALAGVGWSTLAGLWLAPYVGVG